MLGEGEGQKAKRGQDMGWERDKIIMRPPPCAARSYCLQDEGSWIGAGPEVAEQSLRCRSQQLPQQLCRKFASSSPMGLYRLSAFNSSGA